MDPFPSTPLPGIPLVWLLSGPGWRRHCDVCAGSIFNVRLATIDASAPFEACVDCWGAVARGQDPATQDPATQDPATQDPATQDPATHPPPRLPNGP